jgi:hypothetical protein
MWHNFGKEILLQKLEQIKCLGMTAWEKHHIPRLSWLNFHGFLQFLEADSEAVIRPRTASFTYLPVYCSVPVIIFNAIKSWEALQLCCYSRIFQYFMETEGSLPCSKEPSTGTYSEPDQSKPHHPTCLSKIHINVVTYLWSWLIITGSGLEDWIYWHLLLQSFSITVSYNNSQSMTASDSLLFDWTTTVFSSSLFSTVTDLVLIYESLTSGLHECRMTTQWRIKAEWMNSSLHCRVYSLAVTVENVCFFVSAEAFVESSLTRKRFPYRGGLQESTSMEPCVVLSCFLETACMSQ